MERYERREEILKPIISKNCRIRHPGHFSVGPYSIVDDYCYFSTRVKVGKCSHIASGCSIAGGSDRQFRLGDYCSLSSGVKIWCTSNDFVNDVVTIVPEGFKNSKARPVTGNVTIGDMCAVGSNAVIMPDNIIPEGTVIGALSFVPARFKFKSWSVYAGIPVRCIGKRNKKNVLRQTKELEAQMRKASVR